MKSNGVRERLSEYQEITDTGIEKDDYVTIDYSMKINGKIIPMAQVAGYPLEVGTDTLFSELNEALLGLKVGETTTIDKKYPADYSDDHLAGNDVSYQVTIQQIRRKIKPEANDEWANSVTQGAVETMEELRSRVKENLQSAAAQSDREAVRNQMVRKLVEGSTLELPETLLEEEYEHLIAQFESELLQSRRSLEEYLEENSMTEEQYQSSQRILAKDMVRRSLVLQEVASQESLFVTQQEIDNTLRQLDNNISIKEMRKELEKSGHLDSLASRIFHEKVLSFLESKVNIIIEGEEVGEKITDEDTSEAAIAEPAAEVAAATTDEIAATEIESEENNN